MDVKTISYSPTARAEFAENHSRLLDHLINIRGQRVLEIGCGFGDIARVLAEKYDCEVLTLDVIAKEDWPKIAAHPQISIFEHDISSTNLHPLLAENSFDRIISFGTWENIRHPWSALSQCQKFLKPTGKIYLSSTLYRSKNAHNLCDKIESSWPHLLYSHAELMKRLNIDRLPWYCFVNKLTYQHYLLYFRKLGFHITYEKLTENFFDKDFYEANEQILGLYPEWDLKTYHFQVILEFDRDHPKQPIEDAVYRLKASVKQNELVKGNTKKKILVFGSPVSREIFSYPESSAIEVVDYYPRSSFASLATPAFSGSLNLDTISSDSLRNYVTLDLKKFFFKVLPTIKFDMLLLDLIDERFDLLEISPGCIVTLSNGLMQTNALQKYSFSDNVIKNNSDRYRTLWLDGIQQFISILKRIGMKDRLVVNQVYWADLFDNGESLPDKLSESYSKQYIDSSNAALRWMYAQLARWLPKEQFMCFPSELMKANANFKWGPEPFNYWDNYYKTALNDLKHRLSIHLSLLNPCVVVQITQKPCYINTLLESVASERVIMQSNSYSFGSSEQEQPNVLVTNSNAISGDGQFSIKERCFCVTFTGPENCYQLRLDMRALYPANGVSLRLRLSGWKTICYLKVGYMVDNAYRNIKITKPWLEQWIDVSFGQADLVYQIQNDWRTPTDVSIGYVLVQVKGEPGVSSPALGAEIQVEALAIWREVQGDFPLLFNGVETQFSALMSRGCFVKMFSSIREDVLDVVRSYMWIRMGDVMKLTDTFINEGFAPLGIGICLEWSPFEKEPKRLSEVTTYRFSWHALHPVTMLLLRYRKTSELTALIAAREFVTNWLDRSYLYPDDEKYTWYDHGSADRLVAMVLMWAEGVKNSFDQRFMGRLLQAIFRHMQLLDSEMFYAYNQPFRYHNHACFQDIALMTATLAVPSFACASKMFENALARINDQVAHLVVRDSGFAVLVENSIGYHRGIPALMKFAADLAFLAERRTEMESIALELQDFASLLMYPDGRPPAQGDTDRSCNATGSTVPRKKPYSEPALIVLSKAGYAVARGNHESTPFMLTMFATSLCITHKHADNLSFTLFFDGLEWLIDPSYYSYEQDNPIAGYLRGAFGHNSVALPDDIYSIEPGLAELTGAIRKGGEFNLSGTHRAYATAEISRELRGALNLLELNLTDLVAPVSNSCPRSGYLMLHCGEGVEVSGVGPELTLKSQHSNYMLLINLPNTSYQVFHGQIDAAKPRGLTGLRFMQYGPINTVECLIPVGEAACWSIRAAPRI
ncbi:MAG: methyltransferase domain-containing protein [Deltaproteobacteria bacterium]|nr:methyltransferase domain-containing protein [Deltaproteobacteria bacterium]